MSLKIYFISILLLIGFVSYSQTGIGTDSPHASSQLEIFSTTKGGLFPKITLKGETDKTSISGGNPAISLVVYNTGLDANFPIEGFMFWNGTVWRLLVDANTTKAKIEGGLIKNSAVLSPNSYQAGTDYDGILEVGYNGGNGGYYSDGDAYLSNGLSFKLQPGQATGTGKLTYHVSGKPTVGIPSTINNVPINFLNNNLGNINIGGSSVTLATQYTLYRNTIVSTGDTGSGVGTVNSGYKGAKLSWRKDDDTKIESIVLPETGAYIFSFRLYGSVAGNPPNAAPFYLSALKQMGSAPAEISPDILLDIVELTLIKPSTYSNYTYSVNLSVSGKAGDRIYFKMAGATGNVLTWTLINGGDGTGYGHMANRSSMIFWKL
jgi:hypothetical protein